MATSSSPAQGPSTTDRDALQTGLVRLIAAHEPAAKNVTVRLEQRAGTGWSSENWPFRASWTINGEPAESDFFLRRRTRGGPVEMPAEMEYGALSSLAATAVPAPRVRWLDADGAYLGRPGFVMERLAGTSDMMVLTDANRWGFDTQQRVGIARQAVDLLADIHAVRPQETTLGIGPASETRFWADRLADKALEAEPEFEEIVSWLGENTPRERTPAVVHGDFKTDNLMLEDGRVVAAVDWELAHIGNPVEDVAYWVAPWQSHLHLIPGAFELEDFLARYEERTGLTIGPQELRYWQVFALMRSYVLTLTMVRAIIEGRVYQSLFGKVARSHLRSAFKLMEA